MCPRQSITYLLDGYFFFVLFALTVVAIFETGWASLAAVAKIELVRAPRAAFRGAFKRALDGLEALGFIEIKDEKVVRLTGKGRNAVHVTPS